MIVPVAFELLPDADADGLRAAGNVIDWAVGRCPGEVARVDARVVRELKAGRRVDEVVVEVDLTLDARTVDRAARALRLLRKVGACDWLFSGARVVDREARLLAGMGWTN